MSHDTIPLQQNANGINRTILSLIDSFKDVDSSIQKSVETARAWSEHFKLSKQLDSNISTAEIMTKRLSIISQVSLLAQHSLANVNKQNMGSLMQIDEVPMMSHLPLQINK